MELLDKLNWRYATKAMNMLIKIDKSIELAKMIVVANYKELLIK